MKLKATANGISTNNKQQVKKQKKNGNETSDYWNCWNYIEIEICNDGVCDEKETPLTTTKTSSERESQSREARSFLYLYIGYILYVAI